MNSSKSDEARGHVGERRVKGRELRVRLSIISKSIYAQHVNPQLSPAVEFQVTITPETYIIAAAHIVNSKLQ